jgi:tetratricopeptide (TPR) repeat protein
MTEPPSPLSPSTPRRLKRRRGWFVLVLLLVLIAAGATGVWLRRPRRTPPAVPPALDLADADPVVAAVLEKERQRVLQSPHSAAAWGRLAGLLTAFNYRHEALICFAEAERLDPNEPRWPYHQGVLLLLDRPKDAIPLLRRAAALCGPNNLAPRLRLSEALLSLGQRDEAEEGFRAVRQRDSGNARAALGLGRAALQRRQWPQARSYLEAAAADRYSARAATLALAELHQQSGDDVAAARARLRVERLPPDAPWPDPYIDEIRNLHVGKRFRLGQANRLFERGRAKEAVTQLNELVADYPDSSEVWFALGQVLHACGAYAQAERAMGKVVELTPGYAEAYNYLGAARFRQGKFADAESALHKAIELKPDFALAYCNLGRCLHQQKDISGAVAAFRAAVRCKPDYAAAHMELAELLHQTHQDAEALEQVRQTLQLNPRDERAKHLRAKLEPNRPSAATNEKDRSSPP